MQLGFNNSDNGRKQITLVAQNDQDECFLLTLKDAMRDGSIEIIAHDHKTSFNCLECSSQRRYRDCVTAEAHFSNADTSEPQQNIITQKAFHG